MKYKSYSGKSNKKQNNTDIEQPDKKKKCPECEEPMTLARYDHKARQVWRCERKHRPRDDYDIDIEVVSNRNI